MLWIEKYRPVSFSGIVGQEQVIERLASFARTGNVPHLLVTGPSGTGKSTAIECLARGLYGDHWLANTPVFQAGDVFSLGKQYLEKDDRYVHLYRKDESLVSNFKYIVREYASQRPLDAAFKLMVFEEAEALTREAQQALRRTMERFSRTCRFIFCTPHPAGLIPAIRSRCLPCFFAPIPDDRISGRLREILASEGLSGGRCTQDQVDLIVQTSRGDLRHATMLLQLAVESGRPLEQVLNTQTESSLVTHAAFIAMRTGDQAAAGRRLEALMIEYGLTSREVLRELSMEVRREYNDPRIIAALGDADFLIGHCNNEYIQLNTLGARIIREVFS